MATNPRNLILLRLNDDYIHDSDMDRPPSNIDLVRFPTGYGEELEAIADWEEAIMFWRAFDVRQFPDLICADVNFERDTKTPLREFERPPGDSYRIPTGLSHLKPFAAIARASAQPIGISIHTADPPMWRAMVEQHKEENQDKGFTDMIMGWFAAHEIGELSTILGNGPPLDYKTRGDLFLWCWSWLLNISAFNFAGAFPMAIANYRRQLYDRAQLPDTGEPAESIFVLPDDWAQMMAWCDEAGKTDPPRARSDPGLRLYYANGRRDHIALSSLFADQGHGISLFDLPQECFLYNGQEQEPWKLDPKGNPRVGAFLSALGSTAKAYAEAREKVLLFPARLDFTPSGNLKDCDASPLVRGLVVLFQALRRDYENFIEWQAIFDTYLWEPEDLRTSNALGEPTLREVLLRIISAIDAAGEEADGEWLDEWIDEETVAEELDWRRHLHWHLDLLCRCDVLERRKENKENVGFEYRLKKRTLMTIPPMPDHLPQGMELIGSTVREYLRVSLGFDKNERAINKILSQAFTQNSGEPTERERAGSAFLERFLEGDSPPWLIELARKFVRYELGWKEEQTWPPSIRLR